MRGDRERAGVWPLKEDVVVAVVVVVEVVVVAKRWLVRYERRKGGTKNKGKAEKWASFTRLRLVPKAGQGMEGWVKRQQVRQTQTHDGIQHTHTHTRGNSQKALSKVPSSANRKPLCPTLEVILSNIY